MKEKPLAPNWVAAFFSVFVSGPIGMLVVLLVERHVARGLAGLGSSILEFLVVTPLAIAIGGPISIVFSAAFTSLLWFAFPWIGPRGWFVWAAAGSVTGWAACLLIMIIFLGGLPTQQDDAFAFAMLATILGAACSVVYRIVLFRFPNYTRSK